MNIYNYIIISFFLINIIAKLFKRDDKRVICIIFGLELILISALRMSTVGADLQNYLVRFDVIAETPWNNLNILNELWGFEYGFLLLNKIISIFTNDSRILIYVTSFFINFSFSYFIYKYSEKPYLSFYLFVAFNFFGTSLNLVRLFLAGSILLYSIKYLEEKKLAKFVLIVLLATTFHSSALIFIFAYFLKDFKLNEKFYFIMAIIGGIFLLFGDSILTIMLKYGSSFYYDRYGENVGSGDGLMFLIFLVILLIFIIFTSFQGKKIDPRGLYF